MTRRTETIAFRARTRFRVVRRAQHEERLAERHPATVAKRLALAHRIAGEIEAGRYADYADVARRHGLTRARVTQVMDLLLLAPDIQEEVLALQFVVGREPITERTLRKVLASLVWKEQRETWKEIRP